MTLDGLAVKYGTDKSSLHHNYAVIYEHYFKHLQHEPILFVECGIGGYDYPDRGGESARMWREWFTKARIHVTDIAPKLFDIDGVSMWQLSQNDPDMKGHCRGANIFIDDASHINPLTIETFEIVWPVLAPGAFYCIEDIETSWCPVDGWAKGCAHPYRWDSPSAINFCKDLISELNSQYSRAYQLDAACRKDIKAMHFYKNLVIIEKQ